MNACESREDGELRKKWGSNKPLDPGTISDDQKPRAQNSYACLLHSPILRTYQGLLKIQYIRCKWVFGRGGAWLEPRMYCQWGLWVVWLGGILVGLTKFDEPLKNTNLI